MSVVITKSYRQNRSAFPQAELLTHQGKWVAFCAEGRSIAASGETIAELCNNLAAAGRDLRDVVLEKIDLEERDVQLGGAAQL